MRVRKLKSVPPLTNPIEVELLHAIAEHPHVLLDAMEAIPGAEFHREPRLTWYTTPIASPMFAGRCGSTCL